MEQVVVLGLFQIFTLLVIAFIGTDVHKLRKRVDELEGENGG